ncbi:MAG TPA: glycine cleavage system protein GcvH [Firmicutes bacterium]|nr:glycine cleavage system protein GcvH [Bacillota bacterium]
MNFPKDLLYTKTHEFIKVEGDTCVIGITDFAQHQLGDIVFVELPEVGKKFTQGEKFAVVESVKAVEDILMPISGEVVEINTELEASPQLVNEDPYSKGWFVKITIDNKHELDKLLKIDAYLKIAK